MVDTVATQGSKLRAGLLAGLLAGGLLALLAPASAGPVNTAATPMDMAGAMSAQAGLVTGSSFFVYPPSPSVIPTGTKDSAAGPFFPTNGADFAIISSGDATFADATSSSTGSSTGTLGNTYNGGNDVVVWQVDLDVPDGHNHLSLDFQFLSEEFPEFVGSSFNDAFIAELDATTWAVSGATITAPDNFAQDIFGNPITINVASMSAENATGTEYDGATCKVRAFTPITPGPHSLYLSIFDASDSAYDSAAWLDNLKTFFTPDTPTTVCEPPVPPIDFDWTPEPALACEPVTFFLTVFPADLWNVQWDFGDSSGIFGGDGAVHTFGLAQSFDVTVTGLSDGVAIAQTKTITLGNCPPTALFAGAQVDGGLPGYDFQFQDLSTDFDSSCVVAWAWDFNGEATSDQQLPTHVFPTPGPKWVTLQVTDCNGAVSEVYNGTVVAVNHAPVIVELPQAMLDLAGRPLAFGVVAFDQDNDWVDLGMPAPPPGASFPQATGVGTVASSFDWPAIGPLGVMPLRFVATDRPASAPPAPGEPQGGYFDAVAETLLRIETIPFDADRDGMADVADPCPAEDGGCAANGETAPPPAAAAPAGPATGTAPADSDLDGVGDVADNCVALPNVDQADLDQDGEGDLCDADVDGDGVPQSSAAPGARLDNCAAVPNADQMDADGDGMGDACDDPATAQGSLLHRLAACDPEAGACAVPARESGVGRESSSVAHRLASGTSGGLLLTLAVFAAVGVLVCAVALRRWTGTPPS